MLTSKSEHNTVTVISRSGKIVFDLHKSSGVGGSEIQISGQ